MRRVLLIGAGLHAERIYLPLLKTLAASGEVALCGVVELASRRQRTEQLSGVPVATIPDEKAGDRDVNVELLRRFHAEHPFDAMLVANDPRHRDAIFDFACERGVDVFVDKPVFALDGIAHDPRIAADYLERLLLLEHRVRKAGIKFVVQTQRRAHPGYLHMRAIADATVERLGVPVSSLQIQHADGMWVLDQEWDREHQPYKYGFGKLFHSGYHFVDLAAFLLRETLERFRATQVESVAKAVLASHTRLPRSPEHARASSRHGEHDVFAMLDFSDGERSISVAQLALLQNSFSDRDPLEPVVDTYKGIGRVRHERVDLKVSTLLNVQVHSYQSRSIRTPQGCGPGDVDHFEILVFRNPSFFREPGFERFTLRDLAPDEAERHNERARASLFTRFLHREETQSALHDHLLTGRLLSSVYAAVARGAGGFALDRARLNARW